MSLKGRVALITGGDRGVGKGIALSLAQDGADIAIYYRRDEASAKETAAEIQNLGRKILALQVDISDYEKLREAVVKTIETLGKVDILVNNAGIVIRKPAEEFLEEDWDRIMDLNLKGVFFCCQAVAKEMIKKKKGKIINISSNISARVQVIRAAYATSKAGLNHLTRSLAYEWAKYNIHVNVLAPTVTITDMNRKYFLEDHRDEYEKYVAQTPMGRIAEPDDYVGTAIFLASDASDYVTGQVMFVDGGITL